MFDVVIVGGSAAGLSAGLILGRFRRKVLICDSGQPRNARSQGVHGFLSRDGITPQELLRISREQLKPYTTVEFRKVTVVDVVRHEDHFEIINSDGTHETARKILLATGVKDQLPPIEGLETLWGQHVFHCPYCHGWEARDQAIAVIANATQAIHVSQLMSALTDDIVICTNGDDSITDEQAQLLTDHQIRLMTAPIAELKWTPQALQGIAFTDGQFLERNALFVAATQHQHSTLPAKLGCALTEMGLVAVDQQGKTSVDGIYAAGDLTTPLQQVVFAASQGAAAAAFINHEFAQGAFTTG